MIQAGVPELFGEEGFHRGPKGFGPRPTPGLNGIGAIPGRRDQDHHPARASCKITCRPIPTMSPTRYARY
jgi:hypothetical protein